MVILRVMVTVHAIQMQDLPTTLIRLDVYATTLEDILAMIKAAVNATQITTLIKMKRVFVSVNKITIRYKLVKQQAHVIL